MSIEWEDMEPNPPIPDVMMEGVGGSGEIYKVWFGQAFLDSGAPVNKWIALGWPEIDTDNLPLFDSRDDAYALCERWEEIKLDAEFRARAEFKGVRSGRG